MSSPHDRAQKYIFDAVEGKNPSYERVRKDASCICGPLTGSGNWPIQIAAGAAINNDPNGQDLGPFLRGGNGCPDSACENTNGLLEREPWGLNGTEHGSSIYESWNVASIIALINKAPRYRDGQHRDEATRWLKAQFAKYCLSMPRRRPKRSVLYVEGKHTFDPSRDGVDVHPPDGWSYPTDSSYGQSPYPVMVGSRQVQRFRTNDHPDRPQERPVNLDRNQMGPIIAWALNRPRAFPRNPWGWPIELIEKAIGKRFEQAADPSSFGLTQEDVNLLKAFLNERGSPRPLLDAYLGGFTTTRNQECHWIQLKSGDVASWINETIHPSTTGCVLAWTEGEQVHWVSPDSTSRGRSGASAKAFCRRDGDRFVVSADNDRLRSRPVEREFSPFRRQDQLWEVVWDKDGFREIGEPEPVKRFSEHDQAIGDIGELIPRYPEQEREQDLLAACGELLNRHGGQRGQESIDAWQRQRLVEEAATDVRSRAQELPEIEEVPRHVPQHRDIVASVGSLRDHYTVGEEREFLEAFGELVNRQGGLQGDQRIGGAVRQAAVIEAAEAVLLLARKL